jgi:hypothetical protein
LGASGDPGLESLIVCQQLARVEDNVSTAVVQKIVTI